MNTRTLWAWIIEFGAVTAIGVILSIQKLSSWWIAVPVAIILGTKVFEYVVASRERHDVVRRQLQVLLALLPRDATSVRCAYHYPSRHPFGGSTQLVQAFDYLPEGGGGGRRFSIEKGIIGKVYRDKNACAENFANDDEYRRCMIEKYNYSVGELGDRKADRRSYACYPIMDENHVVLGLIYLDADVPGTFVDDPGNPRWHSLDAAAGVVRETILRAV